MGEITVCRLFLHVFFSFFNFLNWKVKKKLADKYRCEKSDNNYLDCVIICVISCMCFTQQQCPDSHNFILIIKITGIITGHKKLIVDNILKYFHINISNIFSKYYFFRRYLAISW